MQIHKTDPLLFSCSLDYTIKIFKLDTYEMVSVTYTTLSQGIFQWWAQKLPPNRDVTIIFCHYTLAVTKYYLLLVYCYSIIMKLLLDMLIFLQKKLNKRN